MGRRTIQASVVGRIGVVVCALAARPRISKDVVRASVSLSKRVQRDDPATPHRLSGTSAGPDAAFDATVDTVADTGTIERFNQTIAIVPVT
jgi:hypothetical protein